MIAICFIFGVLSGLIIYNLFIINPLKINKMSSFYHIEVRRTRSKILRRTQFYSRIVLNGEVVWTGETVKNKKDCLDAANNLHRHMLSGTAAVVDMT